MYDFTEALTQALVFLILAAVVYIAFAVTIARAMLVANHSEFDADLSARKHVKLIYK